MSRAYGWNAKLLIAEESTYGTLSSGPYTQVPFASSAIDSEQGLISSNVLGLGRDPTTPFQDVINVEGDLAVPVDLRNIGIWLKAVFGVPETTNENGVYTHTFESGKTTLPSYSLELGLAEVPEFIRFLGARANSIAFNFARSGEAQATVSLMAQSETASETSVSDAPEVKNYTRFSQFQGFIKSGGETLANVTSASVTYSNNLEKIETIRSDGKVEAIDLGVASLSGSIAVRYGDNALMDKARAGVPVDLELGYPNSQTGNTYKVECQHSPYSIIENINLGVEIKTDLLELILSDLDGNVIDDRTLAYSLAVAIRSGIAKYMNVETEEIGCIAKQIRVNGTNKKGFAIELFDKNASGYCSSNDIIKNLNIIFKYAQNILKCDCAQSCNKCILQNDTKYNYRYLDRKLALEFLTDEWIAKNTLPQDMKIFGDGTLVASASIESLIEDTPNLQKLYLIIPENMENEDFSNSPIYRLVNRYNALNTQIILCVNEKTLGDDVKKTISLLSNLSNVSVKAIPEKLNDKIMAIVWDGFKYYSYASFDENVRQLNQYWGSNINTSILSGYIDINGLKFNDVKLETVENISYDKMFNISSEVNGPGYGFGNRLLSILASSLDKGISSPIVKIEYKDRYLKNPLASGLFYSFIKELKVRYEKLWNCASITLETAETTETNKQYPTMFYHDWDDVDARNEVLTALFDKIGLKFQLKEKNKKYLEHNRIMTIELENGEKINLILDQGFSYWRCLAYCYAENIFPFDADIDEQVAKIGQWLPNVSGDTYPTRIFYTKSK